MKTLFLLVPLLICLSPISKASTAAEYASQSSSVDDPYHKISLIASPLFVAARNGTLESVKVRFVGDKKTKDVKLVVMRHDEGWAFLDDAFDSRGFHFKSAVLKQEVSHGDWVDEELSITMPANYLKSHSQSGLDIRVDGKQSGVTIKLPPAYVQGFLLALE